MSNFEERQPAYSDDLGDHYLTQTDKELALEALDELRQLNTEEPNLVVPGIDVVWGLSAPGSFYRESSDGPYAGMSHDRAIIDHCVGLVTQVTALRLDIKPSEVTQEDIANWGPTFFYNGEDAETKNVNYLQNEELAQALETGECPLPASKVIIDRIPTISTPGQVEGIAARLQTDLAHIGKIAVVSGASHSVRVGRYIEHFKDLFPEHVRMMNYPVPQQENPNPTGTALREVRKVVQYGNAGYLSRENYFVKNGTWTSGRPKAD